jgi:hypothetical protein
VADGADIIVAPGFLGTTPDITDAVRQGVIVIGAAGIDGGAVAGAPALSNGAVATGWTTSDGSVAAGSPTDEQLGLVAPGQGIRAIDPSFSFYGTTNGSSNSSVITAGVIALAMSAHPEATGNQILQALVRTTDGAVHEPTRDERRGFGALGVRQLMTVNPATFPDLNPFIRTDPDAIPSAEDLGLMAEPSAPVSDDPTPPAVDSSPQAPTQPDDGPNPRLIGVVGALLLAAAVSAIVVVRRRAHSGRSDQTSDQNGAHPTG